MAYRKGIIGYILGNVCVYDTNKYVFFMYWRCVFFCTFSTKNTKNEIVYAEQSTANGLISVFSQILPFLLKSIFS